MSRNNGKTKKEQSHKVFLSKEFVSDLTRQNMLYAKIVSLTIQLILFVISLGISAILVLISKTADLKFTLLH